MNHNFNMSPNFLQVNIYLSHKIDQCIHLDMSNCIHCFLFHMNHHLHIYGCDTNLKFKNQFKISIERYVAKFEK